MNDVLSFLPAGIDPILVIAIAFAVLLVILVAIRGIKYALGLGLGILAVGAVIWFVLNNVGPFAAPAA